MADAKAVLKPKSTEFVKKYCAKAVAIGLKGCFQLTTENAGSIRDAALYKLVGRHSVALSFKPSEHYEHNICAWCTNNTNQAFNNCVI